MWQQWANSTLNLEVKSETTVINLSSLRGSDSALSSARSQKMYSLEGKLIKRNEGLNAMAGNPGTNNY